MSRLVLLCFFVLIHPLSAAAHEFTLFYLVPPQTTQAERAEIEVAFQIASHERDVHPNETSDGHLGGVDVHLSIVSVSPDAALITLQPDIVAIPLAWHGQDAALGRFAGAVVAYAPDPKAADAYLDRAAAPEHPDLATAFHAVTGTDAGEWARAAYAMARRIDEVVRQFGDVVPGAALQAAFDTAAP